MPRDCEYRIRTYWDSNETFFYPVRNLDEAMDKCLKFLKNNSILSFTIEIGKNGKWETYY